MEDVFDEVGLPWFLQCSLILGAKFPPETLIEFTADLDITYLTDSWVVARNGSPQMPVAVHKELQSMGCGEDILDMLDAMLRDLCLQPCADA